ncbi:MAG: amidohydrolase family protein [bacterium]
MFNLRSAIGVALMGLTAVVQPLSAQSGSNPPERVLLRAGSLIDGVSDTPRKDQGVLIVGDRIAAVGPYDSVAATSGVATRIDLRGMTVLPGLIDAHTHVFLQGPGYDAQVLLESIPYRTLRAGVAARVALLHGFTTLRDLGTEGAMYADVDVQTAIARGVIDGPRLIVATRAIAPSGAYPLSGYAWELAMPSGVEVADGVDAVRRAVRTQVKFGAQWIKTYADRGNRIGADGTLHTTANWSDDEFRALVDEAHRLGVRVAAHATGYEGIDAALRAGVNSIEHGDGMTPDLLARLRTQRVYWCPTIFVGARARVPRDTLREKQSALKARALRDAIRGGAGDRIAYGTDAGGFSWQDSKEPEARDFSYLVEYGMTPMQAIKSATSVAAGLLGEELMSGAIVAGRRADVIAVIDDPLRDISALERVHWVMRAGVIYPGAGKP